MVMARRIDGGMDIVTKFGCVDCGTVALQLKHEELLNVSVNGTSEKHPVMAQVIIVVGDRLFLVPPRTI
jgi:hypothetical protein